MVGPDVALVFVDTWKRPIVVDWLAGSAGRDEASLIASISQTPLARLDDRWRVFSGLEGEDEEDEEEEEEEEEVEEEDGVRDEEETTLAGPGMLLDVPSLATDTYEREEGKKI